MRSLARIGSRSAGTQVARVLAVAALLHGAVLADSGSPEPAGVGLEQLLNVQVTSVQRKEQKLAHSAAAVHVITREDIRRSGFSSLQDALRLAPGLHVARQSTNVWAIGSRGFNGQFANKLQVLIDGRSMYMPVNSGVFWDSMDLMLDDVDRIEVIRGPGAAMWGANAVTGVINIITRRASETLGTFVEAGSGTQDQAIARVRHGQQLREDLAFRVSGQFARRAHMRNASGATDPWQNGRAGFRLDWERDFSELNVTGDLFRSSMHDVYSVPDVTPGSNVIGPAETGVSGGAVQGRWTQSGRHGQTTAQFSYSHLDQVRSDYISGVMGSFDFDLQHRLHVVKRHDMLLGYNFRTTRDNMFGTWRGGFTPPSRRYDIHGLTIQHEFEALAEKLFLTGGARLENTTLGGFSSQPTIRVLWATSASLSLWAGVSKAVRTPSRVEKDMTLIVASQIREIPMLAARVANSDFQSEKLRAWEAGARWQATRKITFDAALFRNTYSDLEFWSTPAPYFSSRHMAVILPLQAVNAARGSAIGGEVVGKVDLTYRWRVNASASLYDSQQEMPVSTTSIVYKQDIFPGIQAQVHSTLDLHRKLQWDLSHYYTGPLQPVLLPHRQRSDTSIRYLLSEWASISAGVQNLLNTRTPEFRPDDGLALQQTSRAVWVRARWWF